jgi:hypothetical protein
MSLPLRHGGPASATVQQGWMLELKVEVMLCASAAEGFLFDVSACNGTVSLMSCMGLGSIITK